MKGTSDEKFMVVRSWHSRAHSLLSSARIAQPKEVSSASHSSSLLSSARRAQLCPKRSAQLCPKRSAHPGELSSDQRDQLSFAQEVSSSRRAQLIQESSALTKEVSSALHKRSAHPGELSSDQRGQFGQKSSATAHSLRPFRVKRP